MVGNAHPTDRKETGFRQVVASSSNILWWRSRSDPRSGARFPGASPLPQERGWVVSLATATA